MEKQDTPRNLFSLALNKESFKVEVVQDTKPIIAAGSHAILAELDCETEATAKTIAYLAQRAVDGALLCLDEKVRALAAKREARAIKKGGK